MSTGVCFSLKVQRGFEGSHYKEIDLDEKKLDEAKTLCEDRTNMAGFFKASVMPIRTDCNSLFSDLLLPNFINGAMKIHNGALRFLAGVFSIVWDTITLPLRMITYIPRYIYNLSVEQKEHPLIPFLKECGFPKEMQIGLLKIELLEKNKIPELTRGFLYEIELSDREAPIFCPMEGTMEKVVSKSEYKEHSNLYSKVIAW